MPDRPAFEITEDMIDAGAEALSHCDREFASYEALSRAVLEAALQVSPKLAKTKLTKQKPAK